MNKRFALIAFDASWALLAALVVCFATPTFAFAYVDPSVLTYTIQALAGVAVALSAVAGVMWRRLRRFVFKLMKIDENYGKTVEMAVTEIDPAQAPDAPTSAPSVLREPERKSAGSTLSWPRRFGVAVVAMALFMFTFFVIAPIEIVGGNTDSLSFIARDVWWVMVIFAFVVGVVVALGISALRGRAFHVVVAIVFGLAIAGFVQALFLNGGLPSADGHDVPWGDFAGTMAINIVIWAVIVAAVIVFLIKQPALGRVAMVALAVVLIVAQTVGNARTVKNQILFPQDYIVSKEGLFDVSSESNVIVLLVDTVDTQEFEKVLADYPDVMDDFTGFTYFKNSAGAMIPTSHAVPFLLTGEQLQTDETYPDYIDTRYTRSTFLNDIADQNYSISLYADCIYQGKELYGSKTQNIHESTQRDIDIFGTIGILSKVALYRNAPWIAKPAFWYYTDDMNQGVLRSAETQSDYDTAYILDDYSYYNELCERGLTINDVEGTSGSFRMIHLSGSHVPFTLDENVQYSEDTDMEKQTRGTFTILQEYINDLKELGVYDNSTIFIMADHGYWTSTYDDLTQPISPICLVKPAGATGEYTTDTAPVSQVDFQSTVMAAIGGDSSKYGIGLTFFEVPDDMDRVRTFDMLRYDGEQESQVYEFEITGDVLDFSNWETTGKIWMCGSI